MNSMWRIGLYKTKYAKFRQCERALWLRWHRPEVAEESASSLCSCRVSDEVGPISQVLFGSYVEVTTYNEAGCIDLEAMLEKTQQCMRDGVETICQATFLYQGCICAVNILRKTPEGYAIYEVKNNGFSRAEKGMRTEVNIQDIAFQKWVLSKCGVPITGMYLVKLNSDYTLEGELDKEKLFKIKDIAEDVESAYPEMDEYMQAATPALERDVEPSTDISMNCHKLCHCEFWKYCTRNLPKYNVFDLYQMPFEEKLKFYQQKMIAFKDIPKYQLSSFHKQQITCGLQPNKVIIDRKAIKAFLRQLHRPLYFLDFEATQVVVPEIQGTRPFQYMTFQYSLDWIIRRKNGKIRHSEFLGNPEEDPRRALAEQLCRDIPKDVSILAYDKSFECNRLTELAEEFPDLSEHLLNIRDHIKDLWGPFKWGQYYVAPMGNSTSLKRVLPALWPDDPKLDYRNLDERCRNGGAAALIYPKLRSMLPEEREAAREALLNYCRLDSFGMVRVWQKLKLKTTPPVFTPHPSSSEASSSSSSVGQCA